MISTIFSALTTYFATCSIEPSSSTSPSSFPLFPVHIFPVNKSSKEGSGTATTSFQDGLTFGKIFGTRVQDKQICLNVPDVQDVLAIFESNDENEPELPKLTLTNFNANILNTIKPINNAQMGVKITIS